jgi:uncharacterized membrane protein
VDRVPSLLPPLPPPARAVLLGFVTGIRSQVPVALLAIEAQRGRFDPGAGQLARRFGSAEGVAGSLVAFAGELVADKLPMTPRRTTWGPFTQRLVTGGTIGAAVHYDAGEARPLGALLGAAGAGTGAYAATKVRALVAERARLPGPLLGAAEDLFAVALAVAVVTAGRDTGS